MAGVTDAMCLDNAGLLTERRVLVAGAAGGVGRFACHLAALSGAEVCAISRRPALAGVLESAMAPFAPRSFAAWPKPRGSAATTSSSIPSGAELKWDVRCVGAG